MASLLIVDDDEILGQLIQEQLGGAGYKTVFFSDPRDALAFFEEHPSTIDLAIIDHRMPGLSGPELAEKLHAMMPRLPIIIITGFLDHPGVEFSGYSLLMKPLKKEKLLEAVQKMLKPVSS